MLETGRKSGNLQNENVSSQLAFIRIGKVRKLKYYTRFGARIIMKPSLVLYNKLKTIFLHIGEYSYSFELKSAERTRIIWIVVEKC